MASPAAQGGRAKGGGHKFGTLLGRYRHPPEHPRKRIPSHLFQILYLLVHFRISRGRGRHSVLQGILWGFDLGRALVCISFGLLQTHKHKLENTPDYEENEKCL